MDANSEAATTGATGQAEDGTGTARRTTKVFVKTYGCQMNVYDSQRMEDALAASGYAPTAEMEEADLILLNTCHIREKAAEKVYSEIGRIRALKDRRQRQGRPVTLGVTGCVAQAEGEEILRRAPSVDLVAGPQTYHDIASMVERARNGAKVVATEFEIEEKFAGLPKPSRQQVIARGVAAFLTIQEGCDKFCTFCVVPYTRGAEVSRSAAQIIEEAGRLAEAGVREVTLLGQNVNAWHGSEGGQRWRLGDLLARLSEIPGIERLRYTTSHPIDMDDTLIEAHASLGKLMPYLHLPVQAGSDRILKAMNRHHTRRQYLDIIDRIRKARPDMAISGDFIVGFPGESDADFEETMSVVREVGYAQAFSFKYSKRPGTPGAELDGQVDEGTKALRLERLQALLREQQMAFNQACVGRTMDILMEKPGRRPGQMIGRSPWLQSVVVDGEVSETGHMVTVRTRQAGPSSLLADRL